MTVLAMLGTIDFDDTHRLKAGEVDDETFAWHLTAKVQTLTF